MESGNNLNTDIINDSSDAEAATGWESLMKNEDEPTAEFAARALRKHKARKRGGQNLGHVGASALDNRDRTTSRQAAGSEFGNYGVSDGNPEEIFRQDGEDYFDEYEADLRRHHEKLSFNEVIGKYNGLFTFLGENTVPNPNIEQAYQAITGQKEKLQFILDLPLVDKVKLFCSDNFGYANYDNFMHRLQFQQDFINGTAMVRTRRRDSEQGEYVDVEEPLDPGLANPADISLGLERASLRSAMIGTPEYGAYKMALDFASSYDYRTTPDFPEIKGSRSGIYKDSNGSSIGDWRLIIDEYQKIAEGTAKRRPDLNGEDLEYRAVRDAAWIFAASMEYNDASRVPESSYVSSFHESVVWVQLGYPVKAQLRGMRQKIDRVDLHNIGRFLGKSGYSGKRGSFESERSRLNNRVEYINGLTDDGKQEFLAKENAFEIKKQNEWREKEIARINHKYGKLIDKTRSEGRKAVYISRQEEEIQRVVADTSGRIEYFENRTLDGLLSDIDERQGLLSRRIEKRKSLAEKAIELHFELDNGHEGWGGNPGKWIGGSQYQYCLDWINDVPFGTIKRAHKRMVEGMPADEIYKTAISETIRKVVNDPDQADIAMRQMFRDIEDGSGNTAYSRIRDIARLAGKLSKYSEELSYSELKSMSNKDTRWIEDSLAAFSFSDVKQFVDNDLNLSLVPKLSRIAGEFGYELDTNQLIELSSKGIIKSYYHKDVEGIFSSTLRNFSLDEAMTAMDANVDLRILNATKAILSTQGITEFSSILERATKISQFSNGYLGGYEQFISQYRTAINSIGIEKADVLLSHGVDLDTFNMITREFGNTVGKDFNRALELSEKAMKRQWDLENEESAIRTLRNLDDGQHHDESQLIDLYEHGITAGVYEDIFIVSSYEDGITRTREMNSGLSFDNKIKLLQNALKNDPESGAIRDAIRNFDDDMLRQLVEKGADVVHASRVKKLLGRDGQYSKYNTSENILYLVSNNLDVDAFLRAAEAGFSVEEIKMYPFLASGLLIRERTL